MTTPVSLARLDHRRMLAAAAAVALTLAAVVPPRSAAAQTTAVPAANAPADRWWQEGVVYQIYPRSYQDSNGDGIGDLKGITSRLDYLKWLGVDAIWISPFFPSPMRDFGYDVSDYTGVDPAYGTMADFDALQKAAHARGIRVILDFVANHTSDKHAWFAESRSSRTSPKRDWYVWRDPAPNGGPPNNWMSVFGGSMWTLDSATGQYYLHQFLKEQPDVNWRSPAAKRAMYDAMRFWLDRGADGFRLDAFPHFVEDSLFRDNPPNPDYKPGQGDYSRFTPQYSWNQPATLDILCDMRRIANQYTARTGRARLLIGEIYASPGQVAAYYGKNGCGAQLPSNFSLLGAPWKADVVHDRIDAYERALPAGGWPNWVMGNHDNSRLATRVGPAAARAAAVMLLTLNGTPTIYYGDELGMQDVKIPADQVQDPSEKNQPGLGLGRDPERTPMQWSSGAGAGFTTSARPWLPIAPDAGTVNVAAARADAGSTLALYHRVLALRRAEPALNRGTLRLLPSQGDVVAYVRERGASRFLVVVNLAATPATYTLDAPEVARLTNNGRRRARVAASTHMRTGTVASLASIALQPDEAVVLRLR
ncbi:MAG TPA: alpha-amylase family glycosyl hydrolase [Gemmatimonadaceae bacterium]|nr:alpha-amylase family glycosyl hydrolase [Gemmatimonadaceae bacterium]